MFKRDIGAAKKTACAVAIYGAFGRVFAVANFKTNIIAVDNRIYENILLGGELERVDERHFMIASGV